MWKVFIKDAQEILYSRGFLLLIFLVPVSFIALVGQISEDSNTLHIHIYDNPEAIPSSKTIHQLLSDFVYVEIMDKIPKDEIVWNTLDKHNLDMVFIWRPNNSNVSKLISDNNLDGGWYIYAQPSQQSETLQIKNVVSVLQTALTASQFVEDFQIPWWGLHLLPGNEKKAGLPKYPIATFYLQQRNGTPSSNSVWLVPPVIALIVVFIPFLLASGSIVREREIGTLEVLAAAPRVTWMGILFGKAILPVLTGIGVLALLILFSRTFFDFGMKPGFTGIFCLQLLAIMVASLQGLIISSLVRSQLNAYMISAVYLVALILLTGFSLPIDDASPLIQWISSMLPLTSTFRAFSVWMNFGSDVANFIPEVQWLIVLLVTSTGIAIISFYHRITSI